MSIAAAEGMRDIAMTGRLMRGLRHVLDTVYLWCAYLAAFCMVMILVVTMLQVVTRYLNITISGLSSYAGYFMAAATFLALAHGLNRGAHIRIETVGRFMGRRRHWLDLVALGTTTLVMAWFAWHACSMVWWSWKFNDISTGMDAMPMWIPQLPMAFGSVLFALALADNLLQLLFTGRHSIQAAAEVL